MIAGQRVKRRDSTVKRWSSRIANSVRAGMLGDDTPDTGCGLKVFSREAFLRLPYFDHIHRFLPALMRREGSRSGWSRSTIATACTAPRNTASTTACGSASSTCSASTGCSGACAGPDSFLEKTRQSTVSSSVPIDVIGVGNAIVDVLAETDDAFLLAEGIAKGGMTLIDTDRARRALPACRPASRCRAVRPPTRWPGSHRWAANAPISARSPTTSWARSSPTISARSASASRPSRSTAASRPRAA